jgi:hypothetical protein
MSREQARGRAHDPKRSSCSPVRVQSFSCLEKAGARVEPLGRTPKKITRLHGQQVPLACENQRARKTIYK